MIKRAIITFSEKCELSCSFCYSPFNGKCPKPETLNDILSFCLDNEITVITFGGGDPFQYGFFRTILENAKQMGFIVHVDTNCLCIRQEDYNIIEDYVDLLGLPIDGDADTHDRMRQKGHYEVVINCLNQLTEQGTPIKVNTLITAKNEKAVQAVQSVITKERIGIWSIYQFMPISRAYVKGEIYSISDDRFGQIVNCFRNKELPFRLEIGWQSQRKSGYLFIQTDGVLLTHNPFSSSNYLTIGDIYSNHWKGQYERICNSMLPKLSEDRYINRYYK